jgi:hypothetical protein
MNPNNKLLALIIASLVIGASAGYVFEYSITQPKLNQLTADLTTANTRILNTTATLADKTKEIDKLNAEAAASAAEINALNQQITSLQIQLNETTGVVEAIQIQNVSLIGQELQITVKNIGSKPVNLDPSGDAKVQINDVPVVYQVKGSSQVPPGEICVEVINISDLDPSWSGRTNYTKVTTGDGSFAVGSFNLVYGVTQKDFTVVVLPDTQYYSESYPAIFDNQTRWITKNVANLNILFVAHEGDVVNNYDVTTQWQNANHSLSILDGAVPWAVLPGNHDGSSIGNSNENLSSYTHYFGKANGFELFSDGGNDYLVFNLQYNANDTVLAWANTTIAKYPTRRVIVTTHDYMNTDGTRSTVGDRIWSRFIAPHAEQIFLVLCGHNHAEAMRSDVVRGHTVYQILADYQTRVNGGDGWLRILDFQPAENRIIVKTYSPYLNSYETDANSQFTLAYNMTSSTP